MHLFTLHLSACAGCILFPRFAFTTLSDNLLILSLRSMLAQFTKLMVLAVWCFAGFFVAFVTLGDGKFKSMEIIQWMIWIWWVGFFSQSCILLIVAWSDGEDDTEDRMVADFFWQLLAHRFGLDSTGLKEANKLHNVLGPILMVCLPVVLSASG